MNLPPQPPVTGHPLVARYLDELERLLHDVDPVERTEVLDGVREHLEASLHGTTAGEAEVQAALDAIGPPQAVADEAYAGRPAVTATRPAPALPTGRVPATSRRWVPTVVAVLSGLSLLQVVMVTLVDVAPVASNGPSRRITTDNAVIDAGPALRPGADEIAVNVLSLVGALPFWLPMAVLVGTSALWRRSEKVLLIALVPIAMLILTVLPALGQQAIGAGGYVASGRLTLGIVVIGGAAAVTVLVRRGARRVRTSVSAGGRVPDRTPSSSRGWLPASVALLQVAALLLVVLVTSSSSTVSSSESVTGPDGRVITTVGETTFDGSAATGLVGLLAAFPCWLPLVLLVTATGLWTRRERWSLVVVVPLAAFMLGTLPTVGWVVAGEMGVLTAAGVGQLVGLFGGVTLTAVLVRRALVRAATLRTSAERADPATGRRPTSAPPSAPSTRPTSQEHR